MLKRIILPAVAIMICATILSSAAEITIATADLDHFIGTYDAEKNSLTDFAIAQWDTADPMAYHNAISQFPNEKGIYFGLAPWYTNLAKAILPFPEKNITLVSFVDIKLSYAARAIVTKWKNIGDSLEFVCVTENFPELGGAPNLDGLFLLPDSSSLLVTRSAGGDMESIWYRYSFLVEEPECGWMEVYRLESERLMFKEEFTEGWCRLVDSLAPVYYLQVVQQHHKSYGGKNTDGSYNHFKISEDTSMINLWEMVQEARKDSK